MLAYPFLRVTGVVACNRHIPNWNVLPCNHCFNLYNGKNKSRTPHLFRGILSECVSLISGFLIYVVALLFPRFPKLMVANLKVKKIYKNHVEFKSTIFFHRRSCSNVHFQLNKYFFLGYGCFNPFAPETLQITHADPCPI